MKKILTAIALLGATTINHITAETGPYTNLRSGTPEAAAHMPLGPQYPIWILDLDTDAHLKWLSVPGRTYLLQVSDDLQTWVYLPIVESGNGNTITYWIEKFENGKIFARLIHNDYFSDPDQADFDGDGLSSKYEFLIGTDPMKIDTDNDGVNDGAGDYDEDGRADGTETSSTPASIPGVKDNPKVKLSIN